MRIAVAGGSGVVGRYVVEGARSRGHDTVVLARSEGVDLTTGSGLGGRLDGVSAVVDVTNSPSQSTAKATGFFGAVTNHLLGEERSAGVAHHIVLSIVGVEQARSGYYAAKREQERLAEAGPVAWSVLRATQFYEFAEQCLRFAAVGPFSLVPRAPVQPVAAAEVAAALVDLVEAGPSGRAPQLAGPAQHELVDLARRVSAVRALRRRVVPVRMPGEMGRLMRSGGLLPTEDGPRGTITFDEWLTG